MPTHTNVKKSTKKLPTGSVAGRETTAQLDPLLQITIRYGEDIRLEENLQPLLDFTMSMESLSNALSMNSRQYARYAILESRARSALKRVESELKEYEASAYEPKTVELMAKGNPKLSVDAIKSAVRADSKRAEIVEREQRLTEIQGLLSAACTALRDRKDCLVEAARLYRAEIAGGIYSAIRGNKTQDMIAQAEGRINEVLGT